MEERFFEINRKYKDKTMPSTIMLQPSSQGSSPHLVTSTDTNQLAGRQLILGIWRLRDVRIPALFAVLSMYER